MKYINVFNTVKNVCFRDVIYANGMWIITGLGMNEKTETFDRTYHICTTPDLKTFTDKVIYKEPEGENIQTPKIAYGNGVYVAVINSKNLYVSSNAENWTLVSIYNILNVRASIYIKFINGKFIICTWTIWTSLNTGQFLHYEGHILTSTNGKTWSNQTTSDTVAFYDITYYKGYYYVVGTDGYIARSTDLRKWIKCNSGISEDIISITAGPNGMVAIAANKITLFSSNGTKWTRVFKENDVEGQKVEYGNGIYMIMMSPAAAAYSLDGTNFQYLYKVDAGYDYGMAFSQEKQMFITVGNWWSADYTGCIRKIEISRDIVSTETDAEVLYIYDLNFNFIGIIDSFKSLRWRRKYFEAGEFEIVLTDSDMVNLIKKDYLIMRDNYTETGIIETIKLDDDGTDEDFTIVGRFLSSILERRIVKSTINFSGTVVDGMKALLNQMTPFPKFEIEETTFNSGTITFQCTYKNVYDYLIKLSKYSNVAFRVVPNIENKVFIFENYRGLDRTSKQNVNEKYAFSDDEYNIDNATLINSNSTKVNYVLVGGSGEGSDRITVEVNNDKATGFDLYEKFLDAKNQSNKDVNETVYKNSLIQDGKNALASESNAFSFSINANDYKDKFDLGDIVDISKPKWNYNTTARIVEVEEVIEDGIKTVSLVTGTPLPEKFEDD